MSKNKKVTITVSNDELNALEDFCMVDFRGNLVKRERARKKALIVWGKLVKEFDNRK